MARVLILRDERGEDLVNSLRTAGVDTHREAPLTFSPVPFTPPEQTDWIVLTSARTVTFVSGRWPRHRYVAVVGPATRAAAEAAGLKVTMQPTRSSGVGLVAELPAGRGATMWLPRSAIGVADLPPALRSLGYDLTVTPVYDAHPLKITRKECDLVVLYSPSGLLALPGDWRAPVIAIGSTTAEAVRKAGLPLLGVCQSPDPADVLALVTDRAAHAPSCE